LSGAPRLELLRGRALALAAAGRGADALAVVAEGRALHEALPADLDRPGLSFLLFTEVVALGELGRLDDAAEAVRRWRTTRPERTSGNWIALAEARVHLMAGRPEAVTKGLAPLVRATQALGHGATERWALAMVASARLLEGDVRGATDDLARVATLEQGERGLFHTDIDRAHAWLAAELEGLAAARDKLYAAAADAARTGRHAFEAALLHDIARFGDPGAVVERLGQLEETTQGALARARAAHAAGAATCDGPLLDHAVATFEQCDTPLLAAEAATQLADCLADRGDESGAVAARAQVARLRAVLPVGITTPILAGTLTG
jgi:hypothetical protein